MDSGSQGSTKRRKKKKELDAIGKYYKSLVDVSTSYVDHNNVTKVKKQKKRSIHPTRRSKKIASDVKGGKPGDKANAPNDLIEIPARRSASETPSVLAKVHTPSQSSIKSTEILGVEVLEPSKVIWIEKSKANIGMFKITPFEYNIFDNVGDRILFVMPTIGSRENIHNAAGEKPGTFCIHTYMGRDLCDIKYTFGNCFRKSLRAEIRIDDETHARIIQPKKSKDYLIYDAEAAAIMQIGLNGSSGGGLCGPPKIFEWSVYLAKDMGHSVGTIARNSVTEVTVGEPLGFYFKQRETRNKKVTMDCHHKLLIVTMLIGLSLMYHEK